MSDLQAPITVSTGVLTQAEFDRLSKANQRLVELNTFSLLQRYGLEWITQERERLRNELSFAYGTP